MYDYSDGTFGCFKDCKICVMGTFCECWLNGQNWAKSRDEPFTFCHCCAMVHPFWIRKTVLKNNGIEGKDVTDCVIACFCGPCVVCQDARNLGTGQIEAPNTDNLK